MIPGDRIEFKDKTQELHRGSYVFLKEALAKHPDTGEWYKVCIYSNNNGCFVRERNDFFDKFKKIDL